MNVAEFIRKSQQTLSDHSPVILTGAGIAGTIFTSLLVGRAAYKAGFAEAMDQATAGTKADETTKERRVRIAKQTWISYLPGAATGVATIGSIAAANRIGTKRATAMAAAYTLLDRGFMEYKEKVTEKLGEKKEIEIRDAIARDRVAKAGDPEAALTPSNVIVMDEGDVWCFDTYTSRYFRSNMEKIRRAVNDINYEINHAFYMDLTSFYEKLGLPKTSFSDDVGWNSDNLLDVHFSTVLSEGGQPGVPEGKPCIAITFHVEPTRYYYRAHGGS